MPDVRNEQQRDPASEALDGAAMAKNGERWKRRWRGRRQEAAAPEAPPPELAETDAERDWNAVIGDTPASGSVTWADWSPPASAPPQEQAPEEAPVEGEGAELGWSEWSPPPPDADLAATTVDAETDEPPPVTAESPAGVAEEVVEAAETAGRGEVVAAIESADGPAAAPPAEDSPPPRRSARELSIAVWESMAGPAASPADTTAAASTESTSPTEALADEERRYRTTPSWPPPRKPRIGLGLLSLAVMVILVALLVTNGQIGTSADDSERDLESLPALETDPSAVPRDWIVYHHPTGGFGISYPPGWMVRDLGTFVEIRDPSSQAQLRIDQRRPPGKTDPEDDWLEQERDFSSRRAGYRRLQLSEAKYQGHLAALWEYTYAEGNVGIHAADLQFVTKKDRFTLNFRGPVPEWQGLLPSFQGFLNSFRVPN